MLISKKVNTVTNFKVIGKTDKGEDLTILVACVLARPDLKRKKKKKKKKKKK